jgi:hypothetical protein
VLHTDWVPFELVALHGEEGWWLVEQGVEIQSRLHVRGSAQEPLESDFASRSTQTASWIGSGPHFPRRTPASTHIFNLTMAARFHLGWYRCKTQVALRSA